MDNVNFVPRQAFEFLFKPEFDKRRLVLAGARGCGKTYQLSILGLTKLLQQGPKNSLLLAMSGTLQQAKDTFKPPLEWIKNQFNDAEHAGCHVSYNGSECKYSFHVGPNDVRTVKLLSYENIDRCRGYHPFVLLLDECREMPQEFYSALYPTLLPNGYLFAFGTVEGGTPFHTLYERSLTLPDWATLNITASQVPEAYTTKFLQEAKDFMPDEEYRQEYENDWTVNLVSNAVYNGAIRKFSQSAPLLSKEYSVDPSKPVWTAWDIGADGTAIGFFQVSGMVATFVDYVEGKSTFDIGFYAQEVLAKPYFYAYHILPWDAYRKDMRGAPLVIQLENLGLRCAQAVQAFELSGIDAAKNMLRTTKFSSPACDRLLSHLKLFKYVDVPAGKARITRHDEHSHAADMFRYFAISAPLWQNSGSTRKQIVTEPYDPFAKYGLH